MMMLMMMMMPLHVGKADQNECYFLHGPSFFMRSEFTVSSA